MTDFRRVTDDFSVSPQIDLEDMAAAAAQGFTLVINNRPDGEQPGQPTSAEVEAAAKAAGLDYDHGQQRLEMRGPMRALLPARAPQP